MRTYMDDAWKYILKKQKRLFSRIIYLVLLGFILLIDIYISISQLVLSGIISFLKYTTVWLTSEFLYIFIV